MANLTAIELPSSYNSLEELGVADLAEAVVNGTQVLSVDPASGQPSKLLVTFSGSMNDGDNGAYTGCMTLSFSYYYSRGSVDAISVSEIRSELQKISIRDWSVFHVFPRIPAYLDGV